jgi:hypothetical protein
MNSIEHLLTMVLSAVFGTIVFVLLCAVAVLYCTGRLGRLLNTRQPEVPSPRSYNSELFHVWCQLIVANMQFAASNFHLYLCFRAADSSYVCHVH